MPYQVTSDEYLEIDEVPLHTPAWCIDNLFVLWGGQEIRGTDVPIPHGGVLAQPRNDDLLIVTMNIVVFGNVDWEGDPYTNARVGLQTNVSYLKENVTNPTHQGDGTREAVLHMPDLSITSGRVHVGRLVVGGGLGPYASPCTFELSIPAGVLEEASS